MRVVDSGFLSHIQQDTTQLAVAWDFTCVDGSTFHFTNHDVDKTIGGNLYKANPGGSPTAAQFKVTISVNNMQIAGFFGDTEITEAQLRAGKFSDAAARMFIYIWSNTAIPYVKGIRGTLGEISRVGNTYSAELLNLSQALQTNVGSLTAPLCRSALGATGKGSSSGCRYPLNPDTWLANHSYTTDNAGAQVHVKPTSANGYQFHCTTAGVSGGSEPSWNTTIGGTTSDGSVVWTTRPAAKRTGTVTAVTDRKHFAAGSVLGSPPVNGGGTLSGGFFDGGSVLFTSGNNNGVKPEFPIQTFQGSGPYNVTLFRAVPYDIQVGDTVILTVGCDKQKPTCKINFHNFGRPWPNFRGEPDLPGNDKMFTVPASKGSSK